MRIRDWRDILDDVTEGSADADGWRAIAGRRESGVGEDLFFGHPSAGVYQLKTYAKNPYEVKGVGARVVRKVDDGLEPMFPSSDDAGRFAIRRAAGDEDELEQRTKRLEETVKVHRDAPTSPDDLFEDLMEAVDSPAFGPMEWELSDRPERLDELTGTFDEAEELLSAELDDLIEDDGVDRGFQ